MLFCYAAANWDPSVKTNTRNLSYKLENNDTYVPRIIPMLRQRRSSVLFTNRHCKIYPDSVHRIYMETLGRQIINQIISHTMFQTNILPDALLPVHRALVWRSLFWVESWESRVHRDLLLDSSDSCRTVDNEALRQHKKINDRLICFEVKPT